MVCVATSTPGDPPADVLPPEAPELPHAAMSITMTRADAPPSDLQAVVLFMFPPCLNRSVDR
jgi:hypothetical protein